jgi:hypothetical protein
MWPSIEIQTKLILDDGGFADDSPFSNFTRSVNFRWIAEKSIPYRGVIEGFFSFKPIRSSTQSETHLDKQN